MKKSLERHLLKLGEKTPQYPYGYGFCQCGCGWMTSKSASGVYPMYLSRKDRQISNHESVKRRDIADDALVQIYEHEYHAKLDKMGTITHEVEQVTKMVKALRSRSNTEKQLALEKLVGILDAGSVMVGSPHSREAPRG